MKKFVFAVAFLAALSGACAVPDAAGEAHSKTNVVRKNMFLKRFGGFVRDVRVQKGRVAIVNCQSAADVRWLRQVAAAFADGVKIAVEVESGDFRLENPEPKGEVTVFVVDDPKLPISLIAPEARWSVVNVSKLKSDKQAFFETRTMKAVVRAIAPLLGSSDSQYPNCLLGTVCSVEDLDAFPDVQLQVDVLDRFAKNMKKVGIAPWRMTTYRNACQQGWAPQPTNDYQKAIWDKTHELPSKPIKIEYDEKRDKGK